MVDVDALRSERSVHLAEVEGADVPLKRTAGSLGFGERPGELPSPGGWSRIAWAAGDQVGALAADAGSGSELGKLTGVAAVERERAQQIRELHGGRLAGPELVRVSVDETGTDQQQLVPGPRRATQGQYRMGVRCGVSEVQGAMSCAAQGGVGCQWSMSPSVRADCKAWPPGMFVRRVYDQH